jgi:dCTP deaminase
MLLRDEEIDQLLRRDPAPIDPFPDRLGPNADPNLHIQPSSVDLRIGRIYEPKAAPGEAGSVDNPLSRLNLRPGHTAVVETQESLHLPNDYCAIGFPPSHVSSRGILMTNPGHVDPGFAGTMSFTVINMGREPYPLTQDTRIVTLLIFKLDKEPRFPYSKLVPPHPGSGETWETIRRVSDDFINVDQRARKIARKEAGKVITAGSIGTIAAGLAATLLTIYVYMSTTTASLRASVNDLNTKIAVIEATQKQASQQPQPSPSR